MKAEAILKAPAAGPSQRGSALVETALISLLLLMLVAFLLEAGIRIIAHYELAVASREAARVASVLRFPILANDSRIGEVVARNLRFDWLYENITVENTVNESPL